MSTNINNLKEAFNNTLQLLLYKQEKSNEERQNLPENIQFLKDSIAILNGMGEKSSKRAVELMKSIYNSLENVRVKGYYIDTYFRIKSAGIVTEFDKMNASITELRQVREDGDVRNQDVFVLDEQKEERCRRAFYIAGVQDEIEQKMATIDSLLDINNRPDQKLKRLEEEQREIIAKMTELQAKYDNGEISESVFETKGPILQARYDRNVSQFESTKNEISFALTQMQEQWNDIMPLIDLIKNHIYRNSNNYSVENEKDIQMLSDRLDTAIRVIRMEDGDSASGIDQLRALYMTLSEQVNSYQKQSIINPALFQETQARQPQQKKFTGFNIDPKYLPKKKADDLPTEGGTIVEPAFKPKPFSNPLDPNGNGDSDF